MGQPFIRALEEVLMDGLIVFFSFGLLMCGVAIVVKLMSSWMQFGLLFAPESLKPDFNRFNPLNQLKQMFSAQSVINLLMGLGKALLLSLILYVVITPSLQVLINLATSDLQSYIVALIALFRHLLHACLGLLLVLALIDLSMQKYFFAKRMRMTQVEVVKEYKDMEGDPHVKGQRRSWPTNSPRKSRRSNCPSWKSPTCWWSTRRTLPWRCTTGLAKRLCRCWWTKARMPRPAN